MKLWKRLLALGLSLSLCFALAACQGEEDTQYGADTAGDPSASADVDASASPSAGADTDTDIDVDLTQTMFEFASGLKDGDTAVTVNGEQVPNELYLYWLAYDCYYLDSYYYQYGMAADFSDQETAQAVLEDAQAAIVYYTVLRQLCQEHGITITDEQEAQFQEQVDAYVEENGEGSYEKLLQSSGLSEDNFHTVNTYSYLFTNLADQLVGEPTDADLEQYVADNGIYAVKHILLQTTDEDVTDEDGTVTQTAEEYNAEQQALAEDLLGQLQASDELETLFDELMNEYSEDGRDSDGNLAAPDGYVAVPGQMIAEFEQAATALEPGELSGIVESDYGYHIILRLPVDASTYHDDWLSDQTDALIIEAVNEAEVTAADALSQLDVAAFYNRYIAYTLELFSDETDQGMDGDAAQSDSGTDAGAEGQG